MKVEAIKHQDVKGKEQNYIRITKGTYVVLINVGEKTYNSVKELDNVLEMTLEESIKEEQHFNPDQEKKNKHK